VCVCLNSPLPPFPLVREQWSYGSIDMQHALATSHWFVAGYEMSYSHPVSTPVVMGAKSSFLAQVHDGLFTRLMFTASMCLRSLNAHARHP
jgi:hypothetical protein